MILIFSWVEFYGISLLAAHDMLFFHVYNRWFTLRINIFWVEFYDISLLAAYDIIFFMFIVDDLRYVMQYKFLVNFLIGDHNINLIVPLKKKH